MNTSDYVGEIRSQLSDDQFYRKLQFDPVRHFKLETDKLISNAFEYAEISETEKAYLTCEFPIMPVIYILPKVYFT